MRNLLSPLLLTALFLVGIASSALSQIHPLAKGKYEVRLAVKTFDCAATPRKLTVTVQVRSRAIQDTFLMGDANYRFRYDPTQLQNPTIVSQENFSSASPAFDANYSPQNLTGSVVSVTDGLVSLNTFYSGANSGAKLVGKDWMTVACVSFDVLPVMSCIELKWDDNYTFPATGINEVYGLTTNPTFDYNQANVTSGGFFGGLIFYANL